jgi:predicted amidohydrolase
MKIGFAQFAPRLDDPEGNRRQVAQLTENASGADLLVFPELAASGYNFGTVEAARRAAEPVPDGTFCRHLVELSARHRLFLVAGLCEREGDRIYNTAVLAGPDGVRGRYRKIHLFWNEKDLFSPGDLGFPVFDLRADDLGSERGGWSCRAGILICFDWQFPEAWRTLALRGAELVCHPSNLVLPGLAQRAVPVQAMLNRVWTVLSNRHGSERELTFTGRSQIISPRGEVLDEAPAAEDAVRLVDCDPAAARDKMVTPRNDLIRDRRPEFYGELTREVRP